jgi:modulator of FtsH protease
VDHRAAIEAWHDFFVAEVGATAALVGLLFVALSINIAEILKYPFLPIRGGQTLFVLTGALLEASLFLMPAAASQQMAAVCLVVGAVIWIGAIWMSLAFRRGLKRDGTVNIPAIGMYFEATITQLSTAPAVIGSCVALGGNPDGYYWIAAGILFTVAFALYNGWILLIEILR